ELIGDHRLTQTGLGDEVDGDKSIAEELGDCHAGVGEGWWPTGQWGKQTQRAVTEERDDEGAAKAEPAYDTGGDQRADERAYTAHAHERAHGDGRQMKRADGEEGVKRADEVAEEGEGTHAGGKGTQQRVPYDEA